MGSGIRTRIALAAAVCTVALLSTAGTIGYVVLINFTRDSQISLLNDRLDEVEALVDAAGPVRLPSGFRVDTSIRVVAPGAEIPGPQAGTLRVVRTSDHPEVEALVAIVSTRQIDATLDTVRNVLWISILATGLLVGAITWIVVNQALAPVRRLRTQAEDIAADPTSELLEVGPADDELAELAQTFNTMLTKLRTVDDQRRRFVSDASHELRSPLMVLTAEAEYALRHLDSSASPVVVELARSVQDQTDRLTVLVEDLLGLAVIDEGLGNTLLPQPLPEVLEAVALSAVTSPVLDEGERHAVVPDVSRALANLVANALRHRRTRVEVTVEMIGNEVSIVVDDDGPGIPDHEREHVFKRFYRPDLGRARSDGGAGLGLAIAEADVNRAGGSLALETSPLGGARFVLTVPQVVPATS